MKQIKAYGVTSPKGKIELLNISKDDPLANEVQIKVDFCGICHTDLHYLDNDWEETTYPFIPGHEIVGQVIQVGTSVEKFSVGDKVAVGWQNGSCMECSSCQSGVPNVCSKMQNIIDKNGGFSELINVNKEYVFKLNLNQYKPETAPLLCAGITSFNPFIYYKVLPTSTVGVIGTGGLGHMAIKFASKMGMNVTAFSHSKHKEESIKAIGANRFITDISDESLLEQFDFILSTASANLAWNEYLKLLKPEGTLCLVGLPSTNLDIDPFQLIMFQKKLVGGSIGSPETIRSMLKFCELHNINSSIELIKPDKINDAFENLRNGTAPFRYVVDFTS